MRKCSFCKKNTNKLAMCWVLKSAKRKYGKGSEANPVYFVDEIYGTSTVYLCDECKEKEYIRVGKKFFPFIIQENYFHIAK
jgi:hypothetical protein